MQRMNPPHKEHVNLKVDKEAQLHLLNHSLHEQVKYGIFCFNRFLRH